MYDVELSNIKAEMLLNYLYPDLTERWRVEHKGVFYRNYSNDIMSYDAEQGSVQISRDGLLRLVPPRMISSILSGDEIRSESQKEQLDISLLEELFTPIDSVLFRLNMLAERQASQMLDGYEEYIIREHFGYDLHNESNKYLALMLRLLPYVSRLRVDYSTLTTILRRIIGAPVNFEQMNFTQSDRHGVVLMRVLFTIEIMGLSGEEYRTLCSELKPLFDLLREWFIAFDHVSEFRVRNHSERGDVLSYNTRLARVEK